MALLQIAEPGRAAAPHQHRLAVGIDLGTTNSLVATVRSARADGAGRRTRSCAAAVGGALRWRRRAPWSASTRQALAGADPQNTIASAKRLIGRSLGDIAAGSTPYAVEAMSETSVGVRTCQGAREPGRRRCTRCCAC